MRENVRRECDDDGVFFPSILVLFEYADDHSFNGGPHRTAATAAVAYEISGC